MLSTRPSIVFCAVVRPPYTDGDPANKKSPQSQLNSYVEMCVDMCMNMCVDMCMNMCVDMCMDVCVDMCVVCTMDVVLDTCLDMTLPNPSPQRRIA